MKKLAIIFSLLAMCGFIFGACGDDNGGNACEDAANVQLDAWDEACTGKDAECCFCKCWNDGRQFYDITAYGTDQTCTCVEMTNGNGGECTGDALEAAEACLADKDACKATAAALVTDATTGMCTTTPLP
jgi:hypothetical protein